MIKKELKDDLDTFFKYYEEKHIYPYYSCSKEDINKFVDEYLSKNNVEDKYGFARLLKIIMKKLSAKKDEHMLMEYGSGHQLPIITQYIDDELVIIDASDKYKDLIGGKVKKLNNVLVKKLFDEIEEIVNYSVLNKLFVEIPTYVTGNPHRIRTLPSISNDCNEFIYEIEKDNKLLFASINESEVFDNKLFVDNYSYELIEDTIIFHYNSCHKEYDNQMIDKVKELKIIIESNDINNFILDLRFNYGGNSTIIEPLIKYLKSININKYVFINGSTFSSGIFAAMDMKNINAVLIGEEPGDLLNSFGNITYETLPFSKYRVTFSTRYYILNNNDFVVLKTKEDIDNNKEIIEKTLILRPDYEVKTKYDDIINKRDPFMNQFKWIRKEGVHNEITNNCVSRKTKRR